MRIITQTGIADIPYENVMVFVNTDAPSQIYASTVFDTFNDLPLGTYNNKEDAQYVMDCIRKASERGENYFFMPGADYIGL